MSTLKETVFIDRANEIRLYLKEDDIALMEAYPTLAPSRWVLTIDSSPEVEIDSSVNPEAFTWDDTNSILEIAIGPLVTETLSYTSAKLTMYAPTFSDGLILLHPTCTPDKLKIRICE
jgi:hypothetical protein